MASTLRPALLHLCGQRSQALTCLAHPSLINCVSMQQSRYPGFRRIGVGSADVIVSMSRRVWRVVAASLLLGLLAGCQLTATSRSPASSNACTPQGVREVVERFIDAFNRGDIAQLDRLVSQQQFAWYATDAPGQRLNLEADNRENLMAYFAARHRQHEHLVLNSLDVTFTNASRGGLWAYLTRSADDGLPPTRYSSKIEVQCSNVPSSLTVWAMGRSPWSPLELLPQAAALILVAAGVGGIVLWRRRRALRVVSGPMAKSKALDARTKRSVALARGAQR
jgi:hypothetical protein